MAFNQANQAYAEYNRNKVLTASPAELTLLLYEGAIKFCNIAIIGLEQNDMEKVHNNIIKVENIIEEFHKPADSPGGRDNSKGLWKSVERFFKGKKVVNNEKNASENAIKLLKESGASENELKLAKERV